MAKEKKIIIPMPDWVRKQFDLVDQKIKKWSPRKQEWATGEILKEKKKPLFKYKTEDGLQILAISNNEIIGEIESISYTISKSMCPVEVPKEVPFWLFYPKRTFAGKIIFKEIYNAQNKFNIKINFKNQMFKTFKDIELLEERFPPIKIESGKIYTFIAKGLFTEFSKPKGNTMEENIYVQLVEKSGYIKTLETLLDSFFEMFIKDKDIRELKTKKVISLLVNSNIKEIIANEYQKIISEEEAKVLVDFYSSGIGSMALKKIEKNKENFQEFVLEKIKHLESEIDKIINS